jgi:hypothetical protein
METKFIIRLVGRPVGSLVGRPVGKLSGKLAGSLVGLCLLAVLISDTAPVLAQEKPKQSTDMNAKKLREMEKKGLRPPSGPSFFIGPVEGSALFSILLSDGNGRSVSGSFTQHQIEVFEAVLQAAKDFAVTDEAAGTTAPITTRLMEQHEWSLFVDVSKIGSQSRLYLSLVSVSGRLTAQVGEINRGSKKEQSPLLFDILSRLQEARSGIKPQQ